MNIAEIRTNLKAAMIGKDQQKMSVLRLLLSAISYSAMSKNMKDEELTEDDINNVILREIKTRKESLEELSANGKIDEAEEEKTSIQILEEIAPKMLSEDEIKEIIDRILSQAQGVAQGPAMGLVMKELKGKADTNVIQQVVKDFFNK